MSKKKNIGTAALLIGVPAIAAGITVALTYKKNNNVSGISAISNEISRSNGLKLVIKGKNLSTDIKDYKISIEGVPSNQNIEWTIDVKNSTDTKIIINTKSVDSTYAGKKIIVLFKDESIQTTYPELPTFERLSINSDFKNPNDLKVKLEYIGKALPGNKDLYTIKIDGVDQNNWNLDSFSSDKITFVTSYNSSLVGKKIEIINTDSQTPNGTIPSVIYPSISQINSYEVTQDDATGNVQIKITGSNLNQDLANYKISFDNESVDLKAWKGISFSEQEIIIQNIFDFNLMDKKCLISVNDGISKEVNANYPDKFNLSTLDKSITTQFLNDIEQSVSNFTYKNELTQDLKNNLIDKVHEILDKFSNVDVDTLDVEWKEIDPANGLLKLSLKFKFNCEIKQGNYSNFTIDQNDPTAIVLNKEFDTKVNKHLNNEGILTLSDEVLTKINEKLNTFSNSLTNDVKPTTDQLNTLSQELQTTIGDFYPTISINLQGDNFQDSITNELYRQIKYKINFENVQGVSLPTNNQSFTLDNNNQDLISPILDTKVKGYLSLSGNKINLDVNLVDSINTKITSLFKQYYTVNDANPETGLGGSTNVQLIVNELNALLPNDFPAKISKLDQWTDAFETTNINGHKARRITLAFVSKNNSTKQFIPEIIGTNNTGWETTSKYDGILISPPLETSVTA